MLRAPLPVLLVILAAGLVPAQEEPVRGDGRGLAPFGDRGLATFGDRGLASYGRRGLSSFGDTPLASSGGLVQPGPSEKRARAATRSGSKTSPRRIANDFRPQRVSGLSGRGSRSVASIHGTTLMPTAAERAEIVLPPVALPVLTLDHRPALERLESTLREAATEARQRGDGDLARTLGASRG